MSYDLILGDYAHSSWSLRGWLLFERFGIARRERLVDFSDENGVAAQLADIAPARTVPAMRTPEGAIVADSLAMAEELATRHPDAGLWPTPPKARATARWLAAEMHSGFGALRSECPMNLRVAYADFPVSQAVQANLDHLQRLWAHARRDHDGPWLCGEYCAVDAFFAPVATRIATYGLPVDALAADYVAAHLADPAFRRWRTMGLVQGADLPWYAMSHTRCDWPGPTPRTARAIASGTPENSVCPYSGGPVTHLMEMDGRIFGFCNPDCRDETVADPEAWPAFMALV